MTLINGRAHQSHTHVPQYDKSRDERMVGGVVSYQLSPEELAKYRALPKPAKDAPVTSGRAWQGRTL